MIYIRKNGIFYENSYSPDAEEYIFTKVESFIPYLNEVIHIDSEVTLEDLFLLFEKDETIINVIFGSHMGHFPLAAYIEDIKKECMEESREDMVYIECCWVAEQFDYRKFYEKHKDDKDDDDIFGKMHEPDEDDKNEISIYVDVHGWGKYIPAEGEEENYEEGYVPPTHTGYAIEFTPLYRIKHLPIKLNKEFIIKEEDYNYSKDVKDAVNGECHFTVYDVMGAILSELTFAGLPEDRDEKWKDITESVDEYKSKLDEIDSDDLEEESEEQ
jgi:hypothetical protein